MAEWLQFSLSSTATVPEYSKNIIPQSDFSFYDQCSSLDGLGEQPNVSNRRKSTSSSGPPSLYKTNPQELLVTRTEFHIFIHSFTNQEDRIELPSTANLHGIQY